MIAITTRKGHDTIPDTHLDIVHAHGQDSFIEAADLRQPPPQNFSTHGRSSTSHVHALRGWFATYQ